MNDSDIEQTLREFFARDPHGAAAVYLFGSVGRGEARPDSDVDVGVLLEKSSLESMSTNLQRDLEALLETKVDVVILNTASLEFCVNVFRDGKVVLDRDRSARLRFEVATRNEYWDFLPILQRYRGIAP